MHTKAIFTKEQPVGRYLGLFNKTKTVPADYHDVLRKLIIFASKNGDGQQPWRSEKDSASVRTLKVLFSSVESALEEKQNRPLGLTK